MHIAELRAALGAVYVAAGQAPPAWTDPTLLPGVTEIRAVHMNELRAARANAPGQETTATRFYHLDALGSVRAVTDQAGTEVRRHDYAPFGEEPSPAAGTDARRFTGKERDTETGLDYFSARYYQNGTGRFTTVDPGHVGGDIFDPQSWNGYAYARNNPLRFVDPLGTDYRVTVDTDAGTRGYWFDGEWADFTQHATGFRLEGDRHQGWIVDGSGRRVGSYKYFNDLSRIIYVAGRSAEEGVKEGVTEMAISAVASVGAGLLRWGLEAAQAALFSSEVRSAVQVGAATVHSARRMGERNISPGDALAAINSARTRASVQTKIGKYGTPQLHFKGANGITVVVETMGRNAGRIVTTYQTGR